MSYVEEVGGADGFWDIPAAWAWVPVEKAGDVGLGRQRSPENHSGPHMRPYVRAANIAWSGWDLSDVFRMNFNPEDFARFELKNGDVLLNEGSGSASEVGKCAIWRGQIEGCCFQNTLLRVQPRACSPEYMQHYFALAARSGRFVPNTQGVNIFHIGKAGLARFPFPLPPLPEQRRIVAKLDSLRARSARAREELDRIPKLIERYKQAILAKAFSGLPPQNFRPLGDLAEFVTSGSRGWAKYYSDLGPIFVRVGNVRRGSVELDLADIQRVSPPKTAEGVRTSLKPRDIVITITADLGRIGLVPKELGEAYVNQHVALVRLREPARAATVAWYLSSPQGQISLLEKDRGVTRSGLGLDDVRAAPVPDVSEIEASEIIGKIHRSFAWLDKIATEHARAAHLLPRLDQAILAKAFRGDLVPQDPNDEPASALLARIKAERGAAPASSRRRRTRA